MAEAVYLSLRDRSLRHASRWQAGKQYRQSERRVSSDEPQTAQRLTLTFARS
jgi:hypothetical protein